MISRIITFRTNQRDLYFGGNEFFPLERVYTNCGVNGSFENNMVPAEVQDQPFLTLFIGFTVTREPTKP